MDGAIIGLLTGLVGVTGTLVSALLTQRGADRTKARELEQAELRRIDDRDYEARRADLEARRACYVGLNTSARQHCKVLANCRHALKAKAMTEELRARLEESRDVYHVHDAEAQMVLPGPVLDAAREVNRRLGDTYGILKRLDNGTPGPGDSLDSAEEHIDDLWRERLATLRRIMRADLGISP